MSWGQPGRFCIVVLVALLLLAPTSFSIEPTPAGLTVATWNLEFYSLTKSTDPLSGFGGQSFNAFLAHVIEAQGLDILALQEVSTSGSLPHFTALQTLLGGESVFGFVMSNSGSATGQRLAFLYRKAAVDLVETEELLSVQVGNPNLRGALVVRVKGKDDGFDFTLINVHNDSGSGTQDEANRAKQVGLIAEWVADEMADNPGERDFVVLGDFNELYDAGGNEDEGRLDALEQGFAFFYPGLYTRITSGCLSLGNNCRQIDHIAVSQGQGGALQELMVAPHVLTHNVLGFTGNVFQFALQVSDHLPVVAEFENVDLD